MQTSSQKTNEETNHKRDIISEESKGIYSKEERMRKIKYYKEKKQKWRVNHPIKRGFIGRKRVASTKPRIRGKFVKKSIYEDLELSKVLKT